MRYDEPLTPWPRLAQAWWVYGLWIGVTCLFVVAFVMRIRCTVVGRCGGPVARLADLDALGGLPRMTTTVLFVAAAVLAAGAARRLPDRRGLWWSAVSAISGVLAVLKLLSLHSSAKFASAMLTLVGSLLIAAVTLSVLAALGRLWGVAATGPVVVALSCYAIASIGLDAVTSLVEAAQAHAGALSAAAATFVEEYGEALTALVLVVTVRWQSRVVGLPSGGATAFGREPAAR